MRLFLLAGLLLGSLFGPLRPAPPVPEGTAQLTISGDGQNRSGTFPVASCGKTLFPGTPGFAYEVKFKDGFLSLIDDKSAGKQAGAQQLKTKDGRGNLGAALQLGNRLYHLADQPTGRATLSRDLRQLSLDLTFRYANDLTGKQTLRLQGTITCP